MREKVNISEVIGFYSPFIGANQVIVLCKDLVFSEQNTPIKHSIAIAKSTICSAFLHRTRQRWVFLPVYPETGTAEQVHGTYGEKA
jgi:hypothetical protein